MTYFSKKVLVTLGIVVAVALVLGFGMNSCMNSSSITLVEETQEKHFQRGVRLLKEGREQEGLSAFLKVIDKRPDAPESHLEVGRLYLNYIDDPIAAIYHFRKYLEYCPNTEQAPMVRQMIDTARKQFARSLPGNPYQDDMERIDLMKILEEQRAENVKLKKKLALARQKLEEAGLIQDATSTVTVAHNARFGTQSQSTTNVRSVVSQTNSSTATSATAYTSTNRPKTYTVESGDTLSRISQKMYGVSNRWQEILAANSYQLSSPNALRPGQVLTIP